MRAPQEATTSPAVEQQLAKLRKAKANKAKRANKATATKGKTTARAAK